MLVIVVAALVLLFVASFFFWKSEEVSQEKFRLYRQREAEEAERRRAEVATICRRTEFEDCLAQYREVRVAFVWHLGLRVPDSVLPTEETAEVLCYGLDMPVPIPDLRTDSRGISATLSFSGTPCRTFVPWEAVVGVRGYGKVFPTRRSPNLVLVP